MKPLTKKPDQFSLIDDNPLVQSYDDIYGRSKFAISIANHISSTTPTASFALGIIGEWGSGKSDFLSRLKIELNENSKENIVFEFNPWRINNPEGIIDEFFKSLSLSLKPFNQSVGRVINQYSNRIFKSARETPLKLIDAIINNWYPEDDLQNNYNIINESIKATGKRIVVFIDDLDRLSGSEVMEVLRLIRNSASFSNTFFIVGMDNNYVVEVLEKTKAFSNEKEYLNKVFQLTITLPSFKKTIFLEEIKRHLITDDLDNISKEKLISKLHFLSDLDKDPLAGLTFNRFKYESLLEKMIDNIRDLKRFCNSFKVVYNILKDEVEISDLIILELIRNRNIHIYNEVRNRNIITTEPMNHGILLLHNEILDNCIADLSANEQQIIKSAIKFLFFDSPIKNQRKFIISHNFYIYFSFQLFNLISLHEFNSIRDLSIQEILLKYESWIGESKGDELLKIISNIIDFENVEAFNKQILLLMHIGKTHNNYFWQAIELIISKYKQNHSRYFKNDSTIHRNFIFSLLNEKTIDSYIRAYLAYQILGSIKDSRIDDKLIGISEMNLRDFIYEQFDMYLNSDPESPNKCIEFFQLNDFNLNSSNENIILPEACRRFKDYLLTSDNGIKTYMQNVFRRSFIPKQSFLFEPFLDLIFIDWIVFQDRISSIILADENSLTLRRIILKYLPIYFLDKKPFEIIDEDDRIFVENLLDN